MIVVRNDLIIGAQLATVRVERKNRVGVEIRARPVLICKIKTRIACRDVKQSVGCVEREAGPHRAAAGRNSRGPRLRARLSRSGHGVKRPQRFPCRCVERRHETGAIRLAAGRSDEHHAVPGKRGKRDNGHAPVGGGQLRGPYLRSVVDVVGDESAVAKAAKQAIALDVIRLTTRHRRHHTP